jgi:5'-nucleotidase
VLKKIGVSRLQDLFLASSLAAALLASPAHAASATVDAAIFAINDLHGNLDPPLGGIAVPSTSAEGTKNVIPAGGVEYMAGLIRALRDQHPDSIFVAAGDLIGASPLLSGMFHDEPTIDSLSMMGLEASAVGNHEFDKGPAELLRMQNGGCHPTDGCKGPRPFAGAKFHYLAANVIVRATGKTILPPYYVKTFEGVPVAFIGETLEGTRMIVPQQATAGLEFTDEAEAVNALVPGLEARGIKAIVLLIHQGGITNGGYNDCANFSGPLLAILPKLDKAVRVVISGHTHQAYNCTVDGRLVTSAHRYGTLVTEIDLKLDAQTHDLISAKAENLVVRDDGPKDAGQTRLIEGYRAAAAPIENRVIGKIAAPLTKQWSSAGESTLGNVIADAELAASRHDGQGGAQIAFMNSGGIRGDIVAGPDGQVTYAELFSVQPFSNELVTLDLTGAQIKDMLEEQWSDTGTPRFLQVSKSFAYTWDAAAPAGSRIVSLMLDAKPLSPTATYRVAVLDYLADGGDGLSVLREGKNRQAVMSDIESTAAYFQANSPIQPSPLDRIHRLH